MESTNIPKVYVRECEGRPIYFSALFPEKDVAVSWALVTAYKEMVCPKCLKHLEVSKLDLNSLFSCGCGFVGSFDTLITNRVELIWIYTLEKYRHQGYATVVLDGIKKQAHRIITGMDSTEGGYGVCIKNGFKERAGMLEWINPTKQINNKEISNGKST